MADIDLKTETPDTTLPTTGFLFGADSQAAASPSVYSTQTVATTLLGSTSLTGATITADAPVLNLSQTWNDGGTTFTGLKFNATDTASASGSLLMDLQVGGSSRFNVGKTGSLKLGVSPTGTNQAGTNVTIAGSQGTGTGAGGSIIFQVAPAGSSGTAQNALATALTIDSTRKATFAGAVETSNYLVGAGISFGASAILPLNTNKLLLNSTGYFAFSSNANVNVDINGDVRLYRDAANTLALRNGANAQAFRVYNTYTSATEFERANIIWDSNVLKIGTEKGSTGGTARALEFQTDGTTRLAIDTAGRITISNGVIGNAASGNGSIIKFGSSTPVPVVSFRNAGDTGGAEVNAERVTVAANAYVYWNGRSSIYSPADGNLQLTNFAANGFDRLQFGGTTSSFPALKRSSTTLQARLADDSGFASVQGKITTETAYTAGAPTATGYLVLYDSNGTAYKVAAEAL